jgi:hypothetical protein
VASARHKLARLFHADWKEIRTRGGQEFHKRSDLLRYRMGMRPDRIALREPVAVGKFFFAPSEASVRAELLRQHLPHQAEAIVREADEICQHRFRLLGYENLDYGAEIDWHLDRVHGKRAPLEPWFKIPFLDFAVVGDHKVTWELNRHQHLVTLAKAWLLTKDDDRNSEKYVRELIAQWRSWIRANPYPLGINWGSTLEVAFRSLSWIWVDRLLADHAAFAEFRADLLPALAFHGRYVERYLSTYFSPNTHLLGEALALFFIGTLYPQMPHAARWRDEGWKILLEESQRQVRPDGVYFEQSLYYHVYALDFFLHARLLAAQNKIAIPTQYDEVIQRMFSVVEALAQAGVAEGFGDDDGGRLFNPRRNRTEHMTDPLRLGALIYERLDLPGARLTDESIWLFGQRATDARGSADKSVRATQTLDNKHDGPAPTSFLDGGLYVLTGTEPYPQTMVIDAGPQGTGRCGHGHADALSVTLAMNGSRWLVDSGSGVYISSDPAERSAFRGTAAHNTIRVDGVDQAIPDEPFSWTEIPTTRVEHWLTGKTFSYFGGSHNGYERLADPVTHQRRVLRVNGDGGIWLVRDIALGAAEHNLELNWHFADDVVVHEVAPSEFVASRPKDEEKGNSSLRLIMPNQAGWSTSITQHRISPAYGRFESASTLRSAASVKLPAEMATALIGRRMIAGGRADSSPSVRSGLSMSSTHEAAVQVYELRDEADHHAFFFARGKQPWTSSPWSTDAEVLYCRIENEKLAHLIVIGGSSVAWRGEPIVNADGPFQFFEWRRRDGIINSESERIFTTPAFDELVTSLNCSSPASHPTSTYAEKR